METLIIGLTGMGFGVGITSALWGWLFRRDRQEMEAMVNRLEAFLAENEPADEPEESAEPAPPRTDAFTDHLRHEVAFWRLQYQHERQRAEISVDQRLHERGLGPVTQPLRMDVPPQMDKEIQDLLTNPEFAGSGSTE